MKCLITKAAALVLFWALCFSTTLWSDALLIYYLYTGGLSNNQRTTADILLMVLPSLVLFPALPLSGWLADSRFGNFKVFRAGCVLMFLGSVLISVAILLVKNLDNQASFIVTLVLGPISHLISFSGGSACLVTVFQLGLDQMPDASSAGITSFILLFSPIVFWGPWISSSLYGVINQCTNFNLSLQGTSFLPVLCMSVLLVSLSCFGKWLIVEPKSPQSLKNIYRVLKFAAKHKAPLNRSALTYWEEDVPSRLDLGKSRFGGPFTTEQVEDVKTFFRLLLLSVPVWISAFSASIFGALEFGVFLNLEHHNESAQICVDTVYMQFTYNHWWCICVTLFVYKVCVYPCLKNKLPSILKRVGFYLFVLLLVNITYAFINYYFSSFIWPRLVHTWLFMSLFSLLLVSSVEFVCAQSPYSMRGLLSGSLLLIMILSNTLGALVFNVFLMLCSTKHCLIIPYSIGGGLSIAGFLLYLVVAGRYKRRVRDEEYNAQTHIEAIYDRYLTQAQRSHPRINST